MRIEQSPTQKMKVVIQHSKEGPFKIIFMTTLDSKFPIS